ncbi:uncharacterized protein LOC135923513 isoform X2 [Gordionus sp. m RMFG-2023]|uniref:uncharacterized protein LOC135923513 isoform X2 n=1 Tax=Gordionus sp. m RMFG-2023 TaxID=3053472 RepID=UPI0031FDD7D1
MTAPQVTVPNFFNITMLDSFLGDRNSLVDAVIIMETEYYTTYEFKCAKVLYAVLSYIFFKANTIGPSGAFIGMAAYNQTAHVQIPLREAKTYQDFFVRGLPYYTTTASPANTNADGGLARANAMLNKAGRTGALKKVWLFISDTSSGDPVAIAQAMKNNNFKIFIEFHWKLNDL